ncbi:thioredoxin family protein [Granulicella sp. L46]|uniref:thioredoxin family protein n=1 Tax=Granulicella sp. L46 TaxID=1641865 RepID=UPI00131DB6E2|nr:thioredoxin family protein [Granulicella sp. L46]
MSRTESSMVGLGTTAPDFQLVNVMTGNTMNLDEVRGPGKKSGLLIMFVCVHCPYVKHVEVELARIGVDYFGQSGEGPIAIAAIQSNDVEQYPEDGPEPMREQANRLGWRFPYLLDAAQDVARSYEAACTPDFFLFDAEMHLVYRGQLDSSRPRRKDFGNDEPVTGKDLRAAMDALVAGRQPDQEQRSSIGCNIKWREA